MDLILTFLDNVAVCNSGQNYYRGGQRNQGHFRGRGRYTRRYTNTQNSRADNKIVLINPHFKGHVKINKDGMLILVINLRI